MIRNVVVNDRMTPYLLHLVSFEVEMWWHIVEQNAGSTIE